MGIALALPPTAEEIAEGQLTLALHYSGPDTAPVAMTGSGPDEVGYHARQDVASDRWKIDHHLGRYPSVTVQGDFSAEGVVIAEGLVEHLSVNSLALRFGEPVRGFAWLR